MTVKQLLEKSYEGLSTDTKPPSCNVGSTFRETDTNDLYITWDGGTTWIIFTAPGAAFGGNVYSKTMTMSDDNKTRFETSSKKLRDVIISVTTQNMLLGETGAVVYAVASSEAVGFTQVDISTLYFKNATGGQNGTITILATEE